MGYIAAYLDRVNISFAQEPMSHALGLTAETYGLGAGLFFVSYALFEIPSNALLLRFGARRWLARIMLTWGLMAMAMATVHSSTSFYSMRMLLGIAEAGYFPGVIFYLSLWFPARERARAISLFYLGLPLSNVVMGAAAGTLLRLSGTLHLAGWQWLFLVEGLPAVLISLAVFALLPDDPHDAKWLAPEERNALLEHLQGEASGLGAAAHGGWRLALRSPMTWLLGGGYFLMLGANYGLSFSLPAMLAQATGLSSTAVGSLVVWIGVAGASLMLLNGIHSDRNGERRWHIVAPLLIMGALLLLAGGGLRLHGWLAALALGAGVAAYSSFQGPMLSLPITIFSGEAAAVGMAAINMCGIAGGFVFPYLMGWLRERTGGYAAGVSVLAVPCALAAVIIAVLLKPSSRPQQNAIADEPSSLEEWFPDVAPDAEGGS
nr:MFS transporter [Bryocella elongata]